jgi:hypothetical protein
MDKDSKFSYFNPPIYKKNQTPSGTWTLDRVYEEIRGSRLKWKTEKIRECTTKKERTALKQAYLPYVTFAGTFGYRNNNSLIKRSGLIVIDIDHLDPNKVRETRESILSKIKPVLLFISPSGEGLKVVYGIDPNNAHSSYYEALNGYFQQQFSQMIDGGTDIVRTCFLCHDPSVFLSENPEILDKSFIDTFQPSKPVYTHHWTGKRQKDLTPEEIYRRAKVWTEKQGTFTEGTRNRYVHTLTGACHRMGLSENDTLKFISEFQQKGCPIKSVVQSIYKNTAFGNVAPFTKQSQA